jgi:hypothetical protein
LAELLTFFAGDGWLRSRAVETVREILSDPAVYVIPQSQESFSAGFELYRARPDKECSLADCISMQTMRKEGLTEVLTNDRISSRKVFGHCFDIPNTNPRPACGTRPIILSDISRGERRRRLVPGWPPPERSPLAERCCTSRLRVPAPAYLIRVTPQSKAGALPAYMLALPIALPA